MLVPIEETSMRDIDFLRWRWLAAGVSLLVIACGLVVAAPHGGLGLGIDFSGGTNLVVWFETRVGVQDVRSGGHPERGAAIGGFRGAHHADPAATRRSERPTPLWIRG